MTQLFKAAFAFLFALTVSAAIADGITNGGGSTTAAGVVTACGASNGQILFDNSGSCAGSGATTNTTGNTNFPAGSASVPGITFGGDTTTGIFRLTSNDINIALNGNEAVRFSGTSGAQAFGFLNTSPALVFTINWAGTGKALVGATQGIWGWAATTADDSADTGFSRDAADVVDCGNGTAQNKSCTLNVGSLLGTSTGGVGYTTGAGCSVTQLTSRTTGVTCSKPSMAITLFTAAGSATAATFTVTNTTVAATDSIYCSEKSGTNLYETFVTAIGSGTFNLTFLTTGGTSSDAPVFNCNVIKGSAS